MSEGVRAEVDRDLAVVAVAASVGASLADVLAAGRGPTRASGPWPEVLPGRPV